VAIKKMKKKFASQSECRSLQEVKVGSADFFLVVVGQTSEISTHTPIRYLI
jgi:hypothetical protein